MAHHLHHCQLSFSLLKGALQSQQQGRATPNQQTQLKPLGRSFRETPRRTNFTQSRIQGWNSLSLGPNGLTEGDQTNSCKEIPAQAPEREDQILICSQEASKPQLEAEPASCRILLLFPWLIPTDRIIQGCCSKGKSSPVP